MEDESRDFITNYGKDYKPKTASRALKIIPESNLEVPWNKYLFADTVELLKNIRLEHQKPIENINQDMIDREMKKLLTSIYQADYSSKLDNYIFKFGGKKCEIFLPKGWMIPETVYLKSYRHFKHLENFIKLLPPPKIIKPQDSFNRRGILPPKTGITEYKAVISQTGDKILAKNEKK